MKATNNPSTDRAHRREKVMAAWRAAKSDFFASGGRNWKAAKKRIKRLRRDSRRMQNRLIDNAVMVAA